MDNRNKQLAALVGDQKPVCRTCGDRGFLIVPYGISISGTTECDECKNRKIRERRKRLLEDENDE
jgi:hypothetical protein